MFNLSPGAFLQLNGASADFNMKGTSSFTNPAGHTLNVPRDLLVGSGDGNAVFNLAGGTVNIANDLQMSFNDATFLDEFNFTGGALNFTGGASSDLLIGRTGTFNHNNAVTTTVPGDLRVGNVGAGIATFNLQQGIVDVKGNVILGENQNNNGLLNISPGASLTLTGASSNFDMKGTSSFSLNAGQSLTIPNNLLVGSGSGGSAVFNLQGGTVSVGNDLQMSFNEAANLDTFTFTSGSLNFTGGAASDLLIGRTGTFNHNTSGTTSIPGNLHVGNVGAGTATFNLNAGTVDVAGDFRVGTNSGGNGIFTIAPGAQLVLSGGSSNFTMFGTGTYTNPAGHNLNVPGNMTIGDSAGSSVYVQNGGNVVVNGNFLLANNSTGTDEFRLNGGTFSLTGASTFNIGRQGTATISGGTLSVPGNMNIGSIGVVDPSIVDQNGGLVHVGGNLTLASVNASATGDYNLNGGTLQVDGTLNLQGPGTETFTLNGGTLAAVTINDNDGVFDWQSGRLTPGPLGTAATLTYNGSGIVMPAGGIVHFDLQSIGLAGGPNDLLVIPGDLTLDGSVTINALPGFEGTGTYPIIQVFGTIFGDESSLGVPKPEIYSIEFVDFGSFTQINLVIVPEPSSLMLGIGALGLATIARRRRRAAARRS